VSQPLFIVWTPGQSIGFIERARFVNDRERKMGEVEGPAGLSAGKLLLLREVNKIAVVSPNFEGVRAAF
jgi:hypothetical protein